MSRSTGVDVMTGEGLEEALAGVETVIDVATTSSPDGQAATEYFTTAARNLHEAGERAGVRRIVVVSIIGIDHFSAGYNAAKIAQEQAMLSGPVPVRILRAAQFHEFVERARGVGHAGRRELRAADADAAGRGEGRRQGAHRPGHRSATSPTAPISEIAGPREESLVEMATLLTARRGDSVRIEGASNPDDPDRELSRTGRCCPARTPRSPARRTRSGWSPRAELAYEAA